MLQALNVVVTYKINLNSWRVIINRRYRGYFLACPACRPVTLKTFVSRPIFTS